MSRTVEPYHAVCQRGNWYLICKEINPPKENTTAHPSGNIRNFALSRIKNPVEEKDTFSIPKDFDVAKYFDSETGVWLSDTKPIKVELVFAPEVGTFALDRIWHKEQVVKEKKDGSVYLSFKTTQMREVVRFVLGQGHTVKVIGPEELKKAIVDEVSQIAEMYSLI
ncbi:helix-turn-helix transcriptional regulator [Treponema sp.]|uniref:helix-turn-helix transcriptional regulator n=1 Tax=Treponema sp. TaxID=166 RepID=UPI003FD7570E